MTKEEKKAYYRKYFQESKACLRSIGLCIRCGADVDINPHTKKKYWRCRKHRIEESIRTSKRYHRKKAERMNGKTRPESAE